MAGRLNNKISAVFQCHLGAEMFIDKGGGTALYEVAAEDDDGVVSAGQASGFLQLVFVTVVERIIFSYNSVYNHGHLLNDYQYCVNEYQLAM